MRAGFAFGIVGLLVLLVGTAPAASASGAEGSARAVALRVVVPGGREDLLAEATGPPGRVAASEGLEYGSGAVTTGAVWSRAQASGGTRATASARATVRTISLFAGEITVGAISVQARASATGKRAIADLGGSWLAEVTVLGQTVAPDPNTRVPLADWGYLVLLEQSVVRSSGTRVGRRTVASALHLHLTADHGGLPAGADVMIGYVEAAASAPQPKRTPRRSAEEPRPSGQGGVPLAPPSGPSRDPQPKPPGSRPEPPPVVRDPPKEVKPRLTTDGYVFPVYGPSSFTNDFAASRAITGWHHGNDIFAAAAAPVLAVTDGTLFLVGWNDVGGNRLWLRDDQGNEFYFAHLSAFSPLAFEGSRVKAGDVVGFVGATGDAAGTPPHLHFEIHPAALLGLGYDGVVNPFQYLLAWRRIADATFDWGPVAPGDAPAPGLVLLEADDISTVSGLDPEALARVMEMPALFGQGVPPGLVQSG
ncbi:MAG: M23 family metallopeptidase [Thermoleophilia bacterium]|nr:M23 family metallopeptidase [Thermoleophilia bacterium]MDQ3858372.1 M23 family metallopeptidase [Actinomycetota bacterium]